LISYNNLYELLIKKILNFYLEKKNYYV